jgi:single-strand DNA-binding protein
MNGSEVCFVGTLGRDIELRYTTGGRAVGNTSLAVSRRWQQNNEWQEATAWWNLTIWGETGENAAASLLKGTRVIVSGRLEQRSYEKDGETKWVTDLIVDEIGPSMRWATCEIAKTERTTGDGGYQANANRPPEPIYTEEEPF